MSSFPFLPCEAFSHWTEFGQLAAQQTLGISLSLLSYDMFIEAFVSLARTFEGGRSIGTRILRLAKEAPAFYEPLSRAQFLFSYKIYLPFRISLFPSCSCFSPSSLYRFYPALFPSQIHINALLSWLILLGFACWDWRMESSFLWLLFLFC